MLVETLCDILVVLQNLRACMQVAPPAETNQRFLYITGADKERGSLLCKSRVLDGHARNQARIRAFSASRLQENNFIEKLYIFKRIAKIRSHRL